MNKIYTSDISVLVKLFTNKIENTIVFDTENKLVINNENDFLIVNNETELIAKSNQQTNLISLSTIVDTKHVTFQNCFDFTKNHFDNHSDFSYYFFNNPNGTMRWVYPISLKHPSFLTLYNASGWKSKVIQMAFKTTFKLGLQSKISKGKFTFFTSVNNKVEVLTKESKADNYSIFTGTVGENRKVIIEVNRNKKTTNFIKVPLGVKSEKLVQREKEQLLKFGKLELKNSIIPTITISKNPKVAILSNVQPSGNFYTSNELTKVHLNVLAEWYNKSKTQTYISELTEYQLIKKNITNLSAYPKPANNLNIETVNRLIDGLQKWFQEIDESQMITVGMAHFDFTPWNMYVTEKQLHVYDWELSKTDLPLLYDAFHFIFQAGILIKRSTFEDLQNEIEALKSSTLVQVLSQDSNFDFEQSYRFYVLSVASYYLDLYLKQTPLHDQAHWLVEMWTNVIENG
jgi:hypothetical protein